MPWYFEWLLFYFVSISIFSVLVTVYDKIAAKKDAWRVSEKSLLTISAMGGSFSMLITMFLIRHKTRHLKFMLGIPIIMICQAVLLVLLFFFTRPI